MGKPKPGLDKKEPYLKPELRKHGNLRDITSSTAKIGSPGRKPVLGCTRL